MVKILRRGSGNIEDRRASGGRGGFPLPLGRGGAISLPILIIMVIASICGGQAALDGGGGGFGIDIDETFSQLPAGAATGDGRAVPGAPDPEAEAVAFAGAVLEDIQASWAEKFVAAGQEYRQTTLVLFRDSVQSGCGAASSASGPFYCPLDGKVYLDLDFFDELASRFGARGDFGPAYVIAHEVGHHVQNLTGVNEAVRAEQQKNPDDANELSIRLELQADCFAGVWAHSTYGFVALEEGDFDEGLAAAAAVGDDRLQRQAGARVDQESWTHGSSEQRMSWFRKGFDSGDPEICDTFSGDI